jgi:hypothetical protein
MILAALLTAMPDVAGAQAGAAVSEPDTGVTLTSDMRRLDGELLNRTREPLERWGHSFYAFALYIADTAGPPQLYEYGVENSPSLLEPAPIADSLRSAIRRREGHERVARTVGIIVDSIAGPFNEAIDGIDGPPFRRSAITELEDTSGRCRRIEREYRFANDSTEDTAHRSGWGFGRIVYGEPRVTRCEPRRYWPEKTIVNVLPLRPHLAQPIVRSLAISSLDNYFSVVGEFAGTLTVFDDSIVVKLDSLVATRRLPDDNQVIRLDSIRVGVGVGDTNSWSPVDDSKGLRIGRMLPKGGIIKRRDVTFVMLHERSESDDAAWVVVTFHITVGSPGERHGATTYAHSERGVFAGP